MNFSFDPTPKSAPAHRAMFGAQNLKTISLRSGVSFRAEAGRNTTRSAGVASVYAKALRSAFIGENVTGVCHRFRRYGGFNAIAFTRRRNWENQRHERIRTPHKMKSTCLLALYLIPECSEALLYRNKAAGINQDRQSKRLEPVRLRVIAVVPKPRHLMRIRPVGGGYRSRNYNPTNIRPSYDQKSASVRR